MMGMDDVSSMPYWVRNLIGVSGSTDQQFEDALTAFARSHQRQMQMPSAEQLIAIKKANKRANPLHVKAVARRRKRKRGGPK